MTAMEPMNPADSYFSDRLDLFVQPWGKLDGPDVAACAAALQLMPENIPCLLRVQRLAAIAAAMPAREQTPRTSPNRLRRLLREPVIDDEAVRRQEDSYDDVYVQEVVFRGGSKLVLQGMTSRSAHTLRQLFFAVYGSFGDRLPEQFKIDVADLAYAVLSLSDEICRASGLRRGDGTEQWGARHVAVPPQARLAELTEAVKFDNDSLQRLLAPERWDLFAPLIVRAGEHQLRLGVGTDDALILTPIIATDGGYVVAYPSELAASLRHRILVLSVAHGCKNELASAYRNVCMAATSDLMQLWRLTPLGAPSESDTDPVLLRRKFSGPASTIYDVCVVTDDLRDFDESDPFGTWTVPNVGQIAQNLVDPGYELSPEENRTFRLIVTDGFARSVFYGFERYRRPGPLLMTPLDELTTMIQIDGTDPLFLWRFARANERLHDRSEVLSWATLDTYAIYKNHESSFYLSDDRAPTMVSISASSGAPLRREAQYRFDSHHVIAPDGQGYIEVISLYGRETAPIYRLHPRHGQYVLLLETGQENVWVLPAEEVPVDCEIVVDGVVEAVAFWLHQLVKVRPGTFSESVDSQGKHLVGVELDDHRAWADMLAGTDAPDPVLGGGQSSWVTATGQNGRTTVVLHAEHADRALSSSNVADRELAEALASVLTASNAEDLLAVVSEIAPPGEKKMLHVFRASDVLARISEARPRTVQPAVTSDLMDDLGTWLSDKGWPQGEVAPKDATSILRDSVEYYFQRLSDLVAHLSPDGLVPFLIQQDEALLGRITRSHLIFPSQLACWGPDNVNASNLAKDERKAAESSIASRFVLEFVAAQPPAGGVAIDLFLYDELLGISSELVSRATLSDAIHYGFSDVTLSMLESGRLGVSRGDRYSAGLRQFAENEAEAAWALALSRASRHALDASSDNPSWLSMTAEIDEAMIAEYGFSLTELREGLAELVAYGDDLGLDPCTVTTDSVRQRLTDTLGWTESKIESFLLHLTLKPREEFLSIGADAYPWKYNRDCAYIRRPLIEFPDATGVSSLTWGPRRVWHTGGYWTELIVAARIKAQSRPMRRLMGSIRQAENDAFERRVADRLRDGGFPFADHSLKRISGRRLVSPEGEDLGDLDAMGIDPMRRLIVTVEAKDFELARTPAELASERDDLIGGPKSAEFKLSRRTIWVRNHVEDALSHFDLDTSSIQSWKVVPVIVTSRNLVSPQVVHGTIAIRSIDELAVWATTETRKPGLQQRSRKARRRK